MPDTTVKLQDITPVKSTFDNDDQLLLINPTGEALISKDDFLDAMPDDAITLIGDITTTGIEGDTVAKQLGALENSKAPAITETTESSAIANFTDGADDMVMHNIVAEINPVQSGSGDPSPSNIRPITGWTGCNVTRTGKNIAVFTHGKGVDTSGHIHDIANRSATVTPLKIDNTRQYKYVNSNGNAGIYAVWNGDTLVRRIAGLNSGTVMNTSGGDSLYVCGYSGDADVLPETCGVFFADQYEEFEPYQGATLSLSWQTEAGTVYGGTVDVATGLLTVDRAMVTLGGGLQWQTWGVNNRTQGITGFYLYRRNVSSVDYSNYRLATLTNMLPINNAVWGGLVVGYYSNLQASNVRDWYEMLGVPNDSVGIVDTDTNEQALSKFNAFLTATPLQVVHMLATPQTYQLTPQQIMTLLGTNNVWADTGNASVTYPADTKMYIQNLTQPTEDDLVANQAITSGKYFMIGNSLYLALANIASGAQITIGTNAQRVSLADALNTINS